MKKTLILSLFIFFILNPQNSFAMHLNHNNHTRIHPPHSHNNMHLHNFHGHHCPHHSKVNFYINRTYNPLYHNHLDMFYPIRHNGKINAIFNITI